MAETRSATGLGTRRCALGLDLGAPVLEVARRGFSSTFSNQMPQLGRWITVPVDGHRTQPPPVVHLSEGVVAVVNAREPGEPDEIQRVGVAGPGWLGWSDRHHLARLIDPRGRADLVWASTPVVAAFATSAVGSGSLESELVVAIDLDLGVSAAVVSIDRSGARELVSASAPPASGTRSDAVTAVIAELAARARGAQASGANRIVIVADGPGSNTLVEPAIRALDRPWGECPVDVVRTRGDIARAVIDLADVDCFEVVSAAPRALGVLLADDESPGGSDLHVIVPRHAPTPMRAAATFDLGADDGADVYLDLYEDDLGDHSSTTPGHVGSGHRLVLTARLAAEQRRTIAPAPDGANEVELALVVGTDGLLRLEAGDDAGEWTCSWAPSAVVVSPSDLARAQSGAAPTRDSAALTRAREMSPPLGLPEALGRAERALSRRVGRMVAIRSVTALLGVGDRDDGDLPRERLDHLDLVLAGCDADDDAVHCLRVALDVARRTIDGPLGRWYAGGTVHDVTREIERVIEHLAVVIGAVTPAERERLVLDAQLVGLDHDRARSLVHRLITESGVDTDGPPEEPRDPSGTVLVSPQGFRLAAAGAQAGQDEAAIRVLLLEP